MVARTTIAKLLFDPGARADLQKCLETAAPEGLRDGVAIDVRWSRPVRPYPSCAWDDGSGGADDCCSTGGSGCHLEKLEALKIESAALAHATFFAADSPPSACVAKVVTDRLPTDAFKWEGAAGSTRVVVVVRWIGARPSAEASLVGFRCARTAK